AAPITVAALTIAREVMKRIAMFAGGLLAAHAVSAGVYVESVKRTISTNISEPQQKMYVQNGAGRFVDPDGHTSLIKNDTMYIIDDANKSYIVFDKATMQAVAKQLNAAMERAKEQLAKLPPEQREQMEQAMGAMGGADKPHTVEVKDTGK